MKPQRSDRRFKPSVRANASHRNVARKSDPRRGRGHTTSKTQPGWETGHYSTKSPAGKRGIADLRIGQPLKSRFL